MASPALLVDSPDHGVTPKEDRSQTNDLAALVGNRGGPHRLGVSQRDTHLHEGPEGGPRERQAC